MSGLVTPNGAPALSQDDAVDAMRADEAASLEGLPPGDDLMAYTRFTITRHVFAIATSSIPPAMHPDYELITVWRRDDKRSQWRFHERWVRVPGGNVDSLVRLDERFCVLREA